MKRIFLRLLAMIAITSLACTISVDLPAAQPGQTQTLTINEAAQAASAAARVEVMMGGGTLEISGGSPALVSGTIEYNIAEWKPEVTRDGDVLRIRQNFDVIPVPKENAQTINRWDLQLGDVPMELDITVGAYDGSIDLTGVPLLGLAITGGASSANVRFDRLNPQQMSTFDYRTGASDVELTGLSNANFDSMNFTGAAGSYTLDFSGDLQREAVANVEGVAGDITLVVPSGTAARVNVSGGLRDVDASGSWLVENNLYTQAGSGPMLTINVSMSIGSLELISR